MGSLYFLHRERFMWLGQGILLLLLTHGCFGLSVRNLGSALQAAEGRASNSVREAEVSAKKLVLDRFSAVGGGGSMQTEGFIFLAEVAPAELETEGDVGNVTLPGIQATLSHAGLLYARDVLIKGSLSELLPLHIPDFHFHKHVTAGNLDVFLTEVVLQGVEVSDSAIDLNPGGITIFAAGLQANLTLRWAYRYKTFVPLPVKDKGSAQIQVVGLQAGVTFRVHSVDGTLKLTLLQAGTYIEALRIHLHGGASWLYNLFAREFSNKIKARVEEEIVAGLLKATGKLDAFLQTLPREMRVDKQCDIDVSLVSDPTLSTKYLSFGNRGLFVGKGFVARPGKEGPPVVPPGALCGDTEKMVTMAVTDFTLSSAADVHFQSGILHWHVDKLPSGIPFRLDTSSWVLLLPELYEKYPDTPMWLEFNATSAPRVRLEPAGVAVAAELDMFIGVVPKGADALKVAAINVLVNLTGVARVEGNNIAGSAELGGVDLNLQWSTVGRIPMSIFQVAVRGILKGVLVPLLNLELYKGFPLPFPPGITLQKSEVKYQEKYLLVCTDVEYSNDATSLVAVV